MNELLRAIWELKPRSFKNDNDISSETGLCKYIWWLLHHGIVEYPKLKNEIREEVVRSTHCVSIKEPPNSLTLLIKSILHIRKDLQFKNSNLKDCKNIWEWFVFGGYKDLGLSTGIPYFYDENDISNVSLFSNCDDDSVLTPKNAIFLYRISNELDEHNFSEYDKALWYYRTGIYASVMTDSIFDIKLLNWFDYKLDPKISSQIGPWVNRLHKLSKKASQYITFSEIIPFEKETPDEWWHRIGKNTFSLTETKIIAAKKIYEQGINLIKYRSLNKDSEAESSQIKIIGYPKGEFGLGEDIRLLQVSLSSVGLRTETYRATGKTVARENIKFKTLNLDDINAKNSVIVYAVPPVDTLDCFLNTGKKYENATKRIGFWQWELEYINKKLDFCFSLIDEIWCHSDYSERAFRNKGLTKVKKVPLPVDIPKVSKTSLSKYGIPAESFTFFTSFDGASYISRKNPLAVINAFKIAFPKSDRSVSLVLKVMNQRMCSLWRECLVQASLDPRIKILDATLNRNEYYRILKSVNCVVSLHRAEGFGRLMAEAMACGIPVIGSGYSGNMDYMTQCNSWIIPGELVSILEDDYPHFEGCRWFQADVNECANAMVECRENEQLRNQKARKGFLEITDKYNIKTCAQKYRENLQLIN